MNDRDLLSERQKKEVRAEVMRHPKIKELENKIALQKSAGNMMQALMMQKELNDAIERCVAISEAQLAKEVVDLIKVTEQMGEEDAKNLDESIHAVLILADMMEYFITEIDQCIGHVRKGFYVGVFDQLRQLSKEAEKMRMFIEKRSSETLSYVMADEMDKTTELIRNKARALINKTEKAIERKRKEKAA